MDEFDQDALREYARIINNGQIKGQKNTSGYIPKSESSEPEEKYSYIWQKYLPNYRDVQENQINARAISGGIIFAFIAISLLLLTKNLVFGIGMGILILIGFILAFHGELFRLKSLFRNNPFRLFQDTIFWQDGQDAATLYMTQSKNKMTSGMRIFQISTLADNVRPNLNQYIKGLVNSELNIPFTFQVVKKPLQQGSYEICIYIAVSSHIRGELSPTSLAHINAKLLDYTIAIEKAKINNKHHFRQTKLEGAELLTAFRTVFLQLSDSTYTQTEYIPRRIPNVTEEFGKTGVLVGLSVVISLLSAIYPLGAVVRFLIGVGSFIGLSVIWNRQIFSFRFTSSILNSPEIQVLDPFFDVHFFRIRRFPDSLFYQMGDAVVGGLKLRTLHSVESPPYGKPEKFYEAITTDTIPYGITYLLHPLTANNVEQEALEYMRDREKIRFLRAKQQDNLGSWFRKRDGVWNVLMTLSTSYVLPSNELDWDAIMEIERQLIVQIRTLEISYKENYNTYTLVPLKKVALEYGLMVELVKHKQLRRGGTHLAYSLFQGKIVQQLITIPDIFKKGMETRIGAEFNTPIYLDNFITFGNTINTEILEEESPAGFTLDQLHSLLITNGTQDSRDFTVMTLTSELIQQGLPCIIFDTTGVFSLLISLFEDTQFADHFLYFKIQKTLLANPFYSDIAYDKDNIRFLEFMFDAYALCYKKNDHAMQLFRNGIKSQISDSVSTQDIMTFKLDAETKDGWKSAQQSDPITSFLREFSSQEFEFIGVRDKDTAGFVPAYSFITDEKTIIIDLSNVLNRDTQCFFGLLFLAKFIHYIRSGERVVPKFIILPNIDMIFEGYFLDKERMYDRVEKFLRPLKQNNFGFMVTTSQLHFLHENVFDFFTNFIAFKTTDKRDIAAMNTLMGLDSIHGKGMYSSSRKESFQMKYMTEMKSDEAVVKRDDINQPYPVRIYFNALQELSPMSWERLTNYMMYQGYNVAETEKQIINRSQKTLLERDLGNYILFGEEVINFLTSIKKVQKVGHTYEAKVKDELFKHLAPKLKTHFKSRTEMKKIHDTIFTILVTHRYLIEAHPKRAGGGESIRTTYAVGPYYDRVLEDYYTIQRERGITVEPVAQEPSEIPLPIPYDDLAVERTERTEDTTIEPPLSPLNSQKLKDAINQHLGSGLFYRNFLMSSHIRHERYKDALEIAKISFPRFIHSVYINYYEESKEISRNELLAFLNQLSLVEGFPISYLELSSFVDTCDTISMEDSNLEQLINKVYIQYDSMFYSFKQFVEG